AKTKPTATTIGGTHVLAKRGNSCTAAPPSAATSGSAGTNSRNPQFAPPHHVLHAAVLNNWSKGSPARVTATARSRPRQRWRKPSGASRIAGNSHSSPLAGLTSVPARPTRTGVVQPSPSYPVASGEPKRSQDTRSERNTPRPAATTIPPSPTHEDRS